MDAGPTWPAYLCDAKRPGTIPGGPMTAGALALKRLATDNTTSRSSLVTHVTLDDLGSALVRACRWSALVAAGRKQSG